MSKQGNPSMPGLRVQSRNVRNRARILTGRANRSVRSSSGTVGGGKARSSSAANVAHDLSIWKPTSTDPWDHKKAAHLLRRAGFGAAPDEIDAAVKIGMDRT
ncbi:MAG: hypothetical protein ACYTF5_12455, partial [Planctomycetota bacterium]